MAVGQDKTRTMVTVPKELLARLDAAASKLTAANNFKVSRNDVMVAAFEEYLKSMEKPGESAKEDKIMKIYNGENIDVTLATDLGDTVIPAKTTVEVEVPETAILSLKDDTMYVQEEGMWYSKTEQCHTGADMEIYRED